MSDPIVVLVVRDPDASNDITVYGVEAGRRVHTIDVDLGYSDVSSPDEFPDWADSQLGSLRSLPPGHPARHRIAELVADTAERYGHAVPDGIAANLRGAFDFTDPKRFP